MDAITSALSGQTTSRLVLGGVIGLVLAKKLLLGRGHAREPSKTALGARVVLITGCDSGFGRGLVEAALAEGFEVVAACYTPDGAAAIEATGGGVAATVTTVVADLATPEGVEAVTRVAKEVAGARGLYGLVNNAGRCVPGNCGWASPESFEYTMKLNFHAHVAVTYALLPALRRAKGRVVNVSSVCGIAAPPTNAAYSASKHALEAYSDILRAEEEPFGVKVFVVEPGTMRTPLALSYGDTWKKGYDAAPAARRAPYGAAWADATVEKMYTDINNVAEDPQITVKALLECLVLVDPPTRVTTGGAIPTIYRVLAALPDKTRDRAWNALGGVAVPPAALARPSPPKSRVLCGNQPVRRVHPTILH